MYHFNRSMTLKFVEYSFCLLYILPLYLIQYQWKSELETRVSSMTLSTRLLNTKANATTSYYSFEQADKQYGENNSYVERLSDISLLKDLSNEKQCFHRLVPFESNPIHSSPCLSATQAMAFFHSFKQDLLFKCHDTTIFSHCQEFYLFVYDSKNNVCSSFQRKPCNSSIIELISIDNEKGFDGVTLITVITLDRHNRLPYLLKRWKHEIVLAIAVKESELAQVGTLINAYNDYKQITFVIYVIRELNTYFKSIFYDDSGPIYSNKTIFPINLLRDLSIESIDTTHYFICDIDAFPSETLYDSIVLHNETLHDQKAVFVLKLFKMKTRSRRLYSQCRKYGLCNEM